MSTGKQAATKSKGSGLEKAGKNGKAGPDRKAGANGRTRGSGNKTAANGKAGAGAKPTANGKAVANGAGPVVGTTGAGKGRRIAVRRSGVHGKGVYALQPLAKGEIVIEYEGERITWAQAQKRHPSNPDDPNHTFFFHIDDDNVIDAGVRGNAARWINHACNPNCEADEQEGRVFVRTLRNIAAGEELFYDYGLTVDERYTPKLKREYACRCGARKCRGTMLAPKR